ncbi:MAG: hypothetical protein IT208_05275 [Chthonomonadales bacterium]|nr:hypothetical protein [Chthonomonadales bacterium]
MTAPAQPAERVPPSDRALDRAILAAARRLRTAAALRWGARALLAGACCLLGWLAAAALGWVARPSAAAAGPIAVAGLAASAVAWLWRPAERRVARVLDDRAGLAQRLATAQEIRAAGAGSALARLQIADAARSVERLDVRRVLPVPIPPEARALAALAAALLLLFAAPALAPMVSPSGRAERAGVAKRGAALEREAAAVEREAARQGLSGVAARAREARRLGQAMRRGAVNKRDALVALHRLGDAVEREQAAAASAAGEGRADGGAAAGALRSAAGRRSDEPGQVARSVPDDAARTLRDLAGAAASGDPAARASATQRLAEQVRSAPLGQHDLDAMGRALGAAGRALGDRDMEQAAARLRETAAAPRGASPAEGRARAADALGRSARAAREAAGASARAEALRRLASAASTARGERAARDAAAGRPGAAGGAGRVGAPTGGPPTPRLGGTGRSERVTGAPTPGSARARRQVPGAPPERDARVATPYSRVGMPGRGAPEAAVRREQIPAAYREQVRAYFERIGSR